MSYTFIEEYTDAPRRVGDATTFPGPNRKTLPSPCLVEDDDGVRLFLIAFEPELRDTFAISDRVWLRANGAGAMAIVIFDGHVYHGISLEAFMQDRTESKPMRIYEIAVDDLEQFESGPPTRRTIVTFERRFEVKRTDSVVTTEPQHPLGDKSPFVHLHAHSEYSALDGFSTVREMVNTAVKNEQPAIAITDHGGCWGHPDLQKYAKDAGVKPIFGIEAYFVDDRRFRPMSKPAAPKSGSRTDYEEAIKAWEEEQKRGRAYWHLVLWAENDEGLRNLYAMASQANHDGFHYRPRMDWDTLEKYADGVIASTACLRGPLADSLLGEDEDRANERLGRLMRIFDDRLYVELHTNSLPEQIILNERLVQVANESSLPLIVVTDSHYSKPEHKQCHQVWIAAQMSKDLTEDAAIFGGDQDYHLMHLDEVRSAIEYLPKKIVEEATRNTVAVAERCSAKIEAKESVPVFSKKGTREQRIKRDVKRLTDICIANWHKTQGKSKKSKVYEDRFEREMKLLVSKGFCGYFLMVADYCRWARSNGILVGPGRGSGGGCLVAYLCDITDIDPVEADLIFERFLTEGRRSLPDFDVDFPASKREVLTQHLVDTYGSDHVVRVGTHMRERNKGIIRTLGERVLPNVIDIHQPDIDAICTLINDAEANSAGLGESWDNMMALAGESMEPYVKKYPLLFEYAEQMVMRLKTYGKHPAGIIVDPDQSLIGRLPLVYSDNDPTKSRAVAAWDMKVLEDVLHLVKFDLLTLRTLDTLQECIDLIKERHGEAPDFYSWKEEYKDPAVWEDIAKGRTLGLFQVETYAGTRMCKRYKPDSIGGLADVITLVRPGPQRSGLTDMYLSRRKGDEEVDFPHELLEETLSKTYGCILYQEDVMNVCMVLAGYDENEADAVRKMLGKKQVEETAAAGEKFVKACHSVNGIDEATMEHLWGQIAEFAKYSFNRAHAWGYALIAYQCAWLKHYYPAEFLVSILSTVDGKRIPEFVSDAGRRGFKVLPPDINSSNIGFTMVDNETVRYGLASVKGIGTVAAEAVIASRPYTSFEDFQTRRSTKCDSGDITLLASIGAFDELEPNRKALEERLSHSAQLVADNLCVHRKPGYMGNPCGTMDCTFDWTEIKPADKDKKKDGSPKKGWKAHPKKCSRACMMYTPPELTVSTDVYTDKEIRDRERAMLGVYLSSTPFDDLSHKHLSLAATGTDLEEGPIDEYFVVCQIESLRTKVDRNDHEMAFVTLITHDGFRFSAVIFRKLWKKVRRGIGSGKDVLCYVLLNKTDRGFTIDGIEPLTRPRS